MTPGHYTPDPANLITLVHEQVEKRVASIRFTGVTDITGITGRFM